MQAEEGLVGHMKHSISRVVKIEDEHDIFM
jgi:hypothetical protein